MIEQEIPSRNRLERLNTIAKKQYLSLQNTKNIKKLEELDKT